MAYSTVDDDSPAGVGLLANGSEMLAEHQPRFSSLFHRISHLRTHSLTCSSCGTGQRSAWFCTHCHLSLCNGCWASWQYPEATTNLVAKPSRFLRPSTSCLDFRPPRTRAPFSQTIIAGGRGDESHLHIPPVVVCVMGMGGGSGGQKNAAATEYTRRDATLYEGFSSFNFRINTTAHARSAKSEAAGKPDPLRAAVQHVCSLVEDCYAGRFVLDLRAHHRGGYFEFLPRCYTVAEVFDIFITPIARAFRRAQRLTRGRYPAFDSSNAAVVASRILVVVHCCDSEFTTFLQMLNELLASDNIALELLIFQRPLIIQEIDSILPPFMGHYTNALCPLSTFDLLENTLSYAFRSAFAPVFISPRPRSTEYYERSLGQMSLPQSLRPRLPPGGLRALFRRSDPFGVYAPALSLAPEPAASLLPSASSLPASSSSPAAAAATTRAVVAPKRLLSPPAEDPDPSSPGPVAKRPRHDDLFLGAPAPLPPALDLLQLAASPSRLAAPPDSPAYFPLTRNARTRLLSAWIRTLPPSQRVVLLHGSLVALCNAQLPLLVQSSAGLPSPPSLDPALFLDSSSPSQKVLSRLRLLLSSS